MARRAQVLGHEGWKQAGADTRLEHTSATKAEPRHASPEPAHDVFGREMGVLGAAGERGVVPRADSRLQRCADLLPAVAEIIFARAPEDAVGKLRCAKAGEANELRLFVGGGGTLIGLDRGRKSDRREIVTCPVPPRFRKTTRSSEGEILSPSPAGGSVNGRFCTRGRRRVRRST